MLQCEYCDYYKTLSESTESKGKAKSVCKFTEFIFTEDVSALDIEHPCSEVSYQTYLEREVNAKKIISLDYNTQRTAFIDYQRKSSEKKKNISA